MTPNPTFPHIINTVSNPILALIIECAAEQQGSAYDRLLYKQEVAGTSLDHDE